MKQPIKIVIFGVFFSLAWVTLSHAEGEAPSTQIRDPKASDIFVPKELGNVSDIKEAAQGSGKLIILIQDAHVNYEAQKNISGIIDGLAKRYGLKLILVEGGDGDVSLTDLREKTYPEARNKIAESYLKSGLISGEEYLDIVSDYPLILWGVENKEFYDENFNQFLSVEQEHAAIQQDLTAIQTLVDSLKSIVLNEALKKHEQQRADLDSDKISFSEYLNALNKEALDLGINTAQYINLNKLLASSSIEPGLDKVAVGQEQGKAWIRLKEKAATSEIESLLELAKKQKANEAPLESFYKAFSDSLAKNQVDIADLPQLDKYLSYMKLKSSIQMRELWKELNALQEDVAQRLALTQDEKALISIGKKLTLCQKLVTLKWLPYDEALYKADVNSIKTALFIPALNEIASRNSLQALQIDSASLDSSLEKSLGFYNVTRLRDNSMATRSAWKMDELGEKIAVLIAGGFHADELTSRLNEKGIDVVVVTPSVGVETDPTRYERILKVKKGLLPIESIPEMKNRFVTLDEGPVTN
jgi:hypothetical protein